MHNVSTALSNTPWIGAQLRTPRTKTPCSSKKKQRSKSPSKVTPKSALFACMTSDVAAWFCGRRGFGIPFGNVDPRMMDPNKLCLSSSLKKLLGERIKSWSGCAIARIDDNFKRFQTRCIHKINTFQDKLVEPPTSSRSSLHKRMMI